MNPNDPIVEQNIERLLGKAYQPEAPDAAFAADLRKRMAEAAPARCERSRPALRTWIWIAAPVAVAAVVAVVFWMRRDEQPTTSPFRHDGEIVWIDNKPYVPAKTGSVSPLQAAQPTEQAQSGLTGLTARPRVLAPATQPAAVGTQIATKLGEKRRITLDDGSVLYINQNSALSIDGQRRITLKLGEVFVEVSPRPSGSASDPTFIVRTSGREVTALGTKFKVVAEQAGTGVTVTQGKVNVSGAGIVKAGQRLAPQGTSIEPAPRASAELGWTADLMAEANSPLVPESKFEGGALIVVDPWGQETRLTMRKYKVDVHVEDGFARTTIDQTYFNHENRRLEGTFYFPLPADASLSRLAMYVEGNLMEGGMAEREHARGVYESIVYTQRDPALLEWVDGSTFKMRVFPLEARQEKRLIIEYSQKLPELYARTDYRFPAGHSLDIVRDWAFNARIVGGANAHWASESHALDGKIEGTDLVLSASANLVKADADILLTGLDPSRASMLTEQARFATISQDGGRYLMMRYRPSVPALPQRERRDWVILFESSGSRDPLLARAQIDVVRSILTNAEHDDTFAIVTAGTRTRAFAEMSRPATPANVAAAIAFLEKSHLVGALDLERALAATNAFVQASPNPYLVHVGSGVASIGERRGDVLAKRIPNRAKYIGVGIGKNWARSFMKQAASLTGGHFTQINPDENVAWRGFELVSTLNTPRLLDLKVTDDNAKNVFLLYSDSIAHGEEIVAVSRLAGELPAMLTITGSLDGKEFKKQIPVANIKDKAGYIPRTWAKLEIERLLAEDAEKNKQAIIDLSKQSYVMSPFTSLLVLENEKMYEQFKIDRGRKDHWAMYPAPNKIPVVFEPDSRFPINNPQNTVKPQGKRSEAEVLETILVRVPVPMVYSNRNSFQSNYAGSTLTAGQVVAMGAMPVTQNIDFLTDDWGGVTTWDEFGAFSGSGRFDRFHFTTNGGIARWARNNDFVELEGKAKRDLSRPMAPPVMAMPSTAARPRQRTAGPAGMTALRIEELSKARGGWADAKQSRAGLKKLEELSDFGSRRQLRFAQDRLSSVSEPMFRRKGFSRGTQVDTDFEGLGIRMNYNGTPQLLYQTPSFNGDPRSFGDLTAYAPGLNTTSADIQAVLEREAEPDASMLPGTIEDAARKLIDSARESGWMQATIRDDELAAEPYTILFDGLGRYTYQRVLACGLSERVICDGAKLWHLYSSLGLGSVREMGRAYRAEFAEMIPMITLSADDLAAGADVKLVAPNIVGVIPRQVTSPATQPATTYQLHLVFDGTRLTERRTVEMPSGKVLARQTLAADGTVKLLDEGGKELDLHALPISAAAAPDLSPKTGELVILPMPFRTRQHLIATRNLKDDGKFDWSTDDAFAVLASEMAVQHDVQRLIGTRFLAHGDNRIGFYTILLAAQRSFNPKSNVTYAGKQVRFDPETAAPDTPLARYITQHVTVYNQSLRNPLPQPAFGNDRLLSNLGTLRYLHGKLTTGQFGQGTEPQRNADLKLASKFFQTCLDPAMIFALSNVLQNYLPANDTPTELGTALQSLERYDSLASAARYEQARVLYNRSKYREARVIFAELYQKQIDRGYFPLVESSFRHSFQQDEAGREQYLKLVRGAAEKLETAAGRRTVVLLAWQMYQIGDQPLAEEILGLALHEVPKEQRLSTTLLAVGFLWHTGQAPRADSLLEPLLADEKYGKLPEIWRISSVVASQRGMLARALAAHEKAIELDFASMPEVVNLQQVRQDYGQLLGRYGQLADAISTLQSEAPRDLIARTVRAADRWRALDPDDTQACQAAARVLQRLGHDDLAWDYLTTPLAEKPNESSPWTALAYQLRSQGDFGLADKAYATAYEIEPTNAQILWDRAQLLQQTQRFDEARKLYKQLADGQWQPRFQWIQRQAQAYVK